MRRSSLRQHAKPPSTPFFWPYMYKQRYTERRPKCREWCNILAEHRDSRKGVGEKGMDSLLLRLSLSSFITARRIRTECVTVPSPPRPRDPTTFVFSVCDQTGRRTECGNALASPRPERKEKELMATIPSSTRRKKENKVEKVFLLRPYIKLSQE